MEKTPDMTIEQGGTGNSANAADTGRAPRDLHPLLWLGLPLVTFIAPYVVRPFFAVEDAFNYWLYSEFGFLENLQVVALLAGAYFGFRLFRSRGPQAQGRLKWWWLALALGCIFIAGEETSWGQHFIGWQTPAAWSRLEPEQNETNIHNLHRAVNDYPQAVLNLLVVFGGLLAPLYFKIKRIKFTPRQAAFWLWPSAVAIPVAALIIFSKVPRIIAKDVLDMELPHMLKRGSEESQETFVALFLMIYLCSVYIRARNNAAASESIAS